MTRGWLGWRLARAERMVTELVRRKVADELERALVRALCGQQWAAAESRAEGITGGVDLATALARAVIEAGLATDEPFEEVLASHAPPDAIRSAIEHALARWIRAEIPAFEACAELGVDDEVCDWLNDGLDAALRAVWSTLTEDAPLADEDGPDLWHQRQDWHRALRKGARSWSRRQRLDPIRSLCRPVEAITALVELGYAGLTDDEIIEHLERWHRGSAAALFTGPGRARPWPSEVIEDLYDLWQRPQRLAERRRWPGSLEAALGSQFACRAIRYAVMRRRAALSGEGLS